MWYPIPASLAGAGWLWTDVWMPTSCHRRRPPGVSVRGDRSAQQRAWTGKDTLSFSGGALPSQTLQKNYAQNTKP